MLNLFKKKEGGVKVTDLIWMSSEAKWNGLIDLWETDANTVFIFWFDDSLRQAQELVSGQRPGNITFMSAREIRHQHIENKPVVFAEHYPLRKKEQELFQNLHLEKAKVLSALDEPLFKKFGSDNIIQMMKQMGMTEKQCIEHNMISKAIQNAQEKIEGKVAFEQSAQSQSEWVKNNLS